MQVPSCFHEGLFVADRSKLGLNGKVKQNAANKRIKDNVIRAVSPLYFKSKRLNWAMNIVPEYMTIERHYQSRFGRVHVLHCSVV